MKKIIVLSVMCMIVHLHTYCQQPTISGTGRAKNKEVLANVSVSLKGTLKGTISNLEGAFSINVAAFPATLIFSSIGFEDVELTVQAASVHEIIMEASTATEQAIVLSPTRTPVRMLESPVSIERYGALQIRNMASVDYYGHARNEKGVDITTSGLLFTTISTRGFNGSGSTRVNQLVDGMDNQAPGLNFSVGNFAGLTEPDVESFEILPGASSALYGPGGINGTVLINSKNPFQYQGLDILMKEGITNVDHSQRSNSTPYHNFSLRYAKAFGERFAFKVGAQYISGTDWLAHDTSNYFRNGTAGKVIPGSRVTDPNYDGVNVYGDETSLDMRKAFSNGQFNDLWVLVGNGIKQAAPPLTPGINAVIAASPAALKISRTGYQENEVIDPITKNIKLSGALHYKLTAKTEALFMGYWATGNTVYTGNNRYSLHGIKIGQYKLEIKNPNWFIRTYTTQENAGNAYSATVATQYTNEAWKRSSIWYQQYAAAYLQAASIAWMGIAASQGTDAANKYIIENSLTYHNTARAVADKERPLPGSAQFRHLFDSVKNIPIKYGGGKFLETSQLWMSEGQYNFSNKIRFAEIIAGANFKRYILNSEGTLFIDTLHAITINEFGAYAQVTKKLFSDRLTLSFSGRYDKNADFKGRFTPRATAVVKLFENNNIRFSYQTAYRFPSTQQKYIRLDVGDYTILGGLPWVMNYMSIKNSPVVELVNGVPGKEYVYKEFKPESARSFELGYKGWIASKLMIDAYGYIGKYTDFLGRNILYQPANGEVYSTVINSSTQVKTHGYGLGLDYKLPSNFSVFYNVYSDVITDVPDNFQSYFNTPKYRMNAGVANAGMGKKKLFGFNINLHWQDKMMWDGELANGPVSAFTTIDAQVNYRIPKIHSVIKLGSNNLTNHYYKNAYANPEIGGLYYLSVGFHL
ncbi:MAG: TonB-dependent receptor [Flavisolibacter sp.]